MQTLSVQILGRQRYEVTWALQRALAEARKRGEIGDTLLLVEHEPVVSLGKHADPRNLLIERERLQQMGIEWVESDRGGDITWHGPGQLVAYPIYDLRTDRFKVPEYIAALENAMIDVLAFYGVRGETDPQRPGVWIRNCGFLNRKIGFVGVAISHFITRHGLSLNVCPDLSSFDLMLPCGLKEIEVTSIAKETGKPVDFEPIFLQMAQALASRLHRQYKLDVKEDV